jgi:ubiquinone/menaquinone biosynthesis C-methylase UbiE
LPSVSRSPAWTSLDARWPSPGQNVPQARFVQADATPFNFPAASFDAVAVFYSLIHIPRQEQPMLLRKIAAWLRPGGLLVAAMGTCSVQTDFADDFIGAPMYWSSFDSETNKRLNEEAGLCLIDAWEETALDSTSRSPFCR